MVVSENSSTSYQQAIIGGSITLREDDQTFHWTTSYRYTQDRRVTTSENTGSGTYRVDEEEITLLPQPGDSRLAGKLKGNILLVTADAELVYKKGVIISP